MIEPWRLASGQVQRIHLGVGLLLVSCCLLLWLSACPPPEDPPLKYVLLSENLSLLPPLDSIQASDYGTLIDLDNFTFLMNNFPCNETGRQSTVLLLVLVHSAPGNFDKRQTIRNTWGSQKRNPDVRVLFLIGQVSSPELQFTLEDENDRYHDLVQGSFVDSYRNMTYKHIMGLKWVTYYCHKVRYVLKCDDDVFVNTPRLLDFIATRLSVHGARRLLLCSRFPFAYVKRSYRSKWRVSYNEYPNKLYPAYCAGWGVIYSPDIVYLLYQEAQKSPYFWIDDVHVTGTLAVKANVSHTHLASNWVLSVADAERLMSSQVDSDIGFLFGAPDFSTDTISELWHYVVKKQELLRRQNLPL